ncbi:MAG: beta-N-acetylhexosaminidase [Anaerolineaceae bacterium]|nr:beta-N-acetylhexosaminidase [Anaerolineaceae bacterium]
MLNIIPKPVLVTETGDLFTLTDKTNICIQSGAAEMAALAQYLAERLRPATGYPLPVVVGGETQQDGNIYLTTAGTDPALAGEGYELTIAHTALTLAAHQAAGIFYGIQTIRQLLPASIESSTAQVDNWSIPTGKIRDYPRFAWRGAMLDVARHFFGVADIKRYLDLLSLYKLNHFHLHLSDDQGWRIMINSWPNLALLGGISAVNDDGGGYLSQAEYAEIIAYARSRFIEVIPEIDLPGHTNAVLAAYPELNRDGVAPALYTGIEVGFSSLCTDKEITYKFVENVLAEIAAITLAPYLHIGGDEASSTLPADYKQFIERVQRIVKSLGKQMIGWEEIANVDLLPGSIVQSWKSNTVKKAVEQGAKVIYSPGARTYLDMKYDASTPLGLKWAGFIDVPDAYNWDPAEQEAGVAESSILGVEAPLWSETLRTMQDIEYMAFPRLPALAEIGWSAKAARNWHDFAIRLGTQSPRWEALGVNFYRSAQVEWS